MCIARDSRTTYLVLSQSRLSLESREEHSSTASRNSLIPTSNLVWEWKKSFRYSEFSCFDDVGGRAKDMWFAVLLSGSGSVHVQRVLNFRGFVCSWSVQI